MDWPLLLNYVLPYVFGIVTSVAIAYYAWQRRHIRGAEFFCLYLLAAVDWSICMLLMLFTSNPILDKVWHFVSDMGVAVMPVMWFAFTLKYTRREKWLSPLVGILIVAEPLSAILLNIITYTYTLIAQILNIETLLYIVHYIHRLNNIVQDVHYIYLAMLVLAGAFLMFQTMLRAPRMYQSQFIYLLIGTVLPWIFAYIKIFDFAIFSGIDPQPIAFAAGGLISAGAMFRYQVFDILPVALDTVVENISDGVMVLDDLYRIVDMNPAAQTMLNLSLEYIAGIPAPQILNTWENLDTYLAEEETQTLAITLGTPDVPRYCEARLSPMRDRQKAIFGRMIILRDISERRQAAEEMRRAKEIAEENARLAEENAHAAESANQAKSVFLANMSHELRTPLNAILGFSELMYRDPALNADQRENLETINRSGQHLLTLINDVLEMSKIEAGRTTLFEQSFDLHRLLAALESMFHLRAVNKGLQLIFDSRPNVPQYIYTDESKLRQILINLLSNAIKFTTEGGVTLRLRCRDAAIEPPNRVTLDFEVEDTGAGIAPEDIARLFDPFVQTASGQQSQEGTGLGLPISQEFVKLMGGAIIVESIAGQGSVFKVSIQAAVAEASAVPGEENARRVKALAPDQPLCRILVVEDRDASRKLLIKLLQPLGFDVRGVGNGQLAVDTFEDAAWDPHLIWMDMRMPVMDGYEATKRIKATTKGQATVIIALTASAFEEDRAMILSNGCDDFLRKPFREVEIFQMLEKHLGIRFIYKENEAEDEAATVSEADLTPELLATLPSDWVAALNAASLQADIDATLTLLDQIRDDSPPLTNALTKLVNNFRFDVLMELSQSTSGKPTATL